MSAYGQRLEVVFTGVLLACGPRPALGRMADRLEWGVEVANMLGATVNQHYEARKELTKSFMRWLETRENHADLQREKEDADGYAAVPKGRDITT